MIENIWRKFVNLVNSVEQRIKDLSKKAKIIISVIIAVLGIGGTGIITASSHGLGPIWPTYTDRLYSFDGNLAWTALTGNGNLQAQTDGMWVGRSDDSSNIGFNDSANGQVSISVDSGGLEIIGNPSSPSLVGGYSGNSTDGIADVICGGGAPGYANTNRIASSGGANTVCGGYGNVITSGSKSTIVNGASNHIDGATESTIAGGQLNEIIGWNVFQQDHFIGAGRGNIIYGPSPAVGTNSNAIVAGKFNWIGDGNDAHDSGVFVGQNNSITNSYNSFISAGTQNGIEYGFGNWIGAGSLNLIEGPTNEENFIGAGDHNVLTDCIDCSIVTGDTCTATGAANIIGSGDGNSIDGYYSGILTGFDIDISADYAQAGGRRAKVNHDGAFVWADSTNADFASQRADQFRVRASGGGYFNQDSTTAAQPVLELDQDDTNESFINYIGTSSADQLSSISTVNGDGVVDGPKNAAAAAGWTFEGMVRIEINGAEYWMPYYSVDTP